MCSRLVLSQVNAYSQCVLLWCPGRCLRIVGIACTCLPQRLVLWVRVCWSFLNDWGARGGDNKLESYNNICGLKGYY